MKSSVSIKSIFLLLTASSSMIIGSCKKDGTTITPPPPPSATTDSVLFSDDFSSGNANKWPRQNIDGNGSITFVNQPALNSPYAVKFTVPNDGVSYRAELATDSLPYGTYRYRFAVYIPTNWVQDTLGTIVAQWHGYKLINGSDTNPPVSLAVKGNNWVLNINTLQNPTTTTKQVFNLAQLQTGVWNQFDVRIAWSTATQTGTVAIYNNGQLLKNYSGVNNYSQNFPPYFKIGIYKPEWNPKHGLNYPTGGAPVIVYHDAVILSKYSGPM